MVTADIARLLSKNSESVIEQYIKEIDNDIITSAKLGNNNYIKSIFCTIDIEKLANHYKKQGFETSTIQHCSCTDLIIQW